MLTELVITLVAGLIELAIVLSPIALIITIIRYKKKGSSSNKKINIHTAEERQIERTEQEHESQEQTSYYTGWWWNEDKKLWEPPENAKKTTNDTDKTEEINYRRAYQARQLFTRNEWQNYKKLRDIAEIKGYIICPKVRLLDIIEPKKGERKYKTLFYKIQAKHVDFVICDKDMHIKAIIELDDNSHDTKDRKERDEFVNMILHSVGYKVIHTRYITNDILDLV